MMSLFGDIIGTLIQPIFQARFLQPALGMVFIRNTCKITMPLRTTVHTNTFIPFMRDVARCEISLRELNLTWHLIEASAKMNCPEEAHNILPMMAATRAGFQRLESDLVASLVDESVTKVMDELGTHALHVIDIVVRNLYERTADVGFLATDQELCHFMAGNPTGHGVLERLHEYRNKYTVYDDILLLDTQGNVLAQTDENSPVEGSRDPLIAETLPRAGYTETFRASDLRPGKSRALLYAHRMLAPGSKEPVGVLCLSFDFYSEMETIFHSRKGEDCRNIALLLDTDNQVIATSDPLWVPLGAQVPTNQDGAARPIIFSGRTYLVRTVAAQSYQGYPGPTGWKGQVMVPIELAFSGQNERVIHQLDPGIAEGLMAHAQNFCPPLYEIVTAANTIRRVVWNGQVISAGQSGNGQKLKAILEQIGDTGARTNDVFTQSISDLYDTVLSSSMRDGECLTQLLVDLIDRNLYERANDCRWWALTPELRTLLTAGLQQGVVADSDCDAISQLLTQINQLYTVYSRLVVYDRQGLILAASHPTCQNGHHVIGTRIDSATVAAVLALRDTQSYHVSAWAPQPLDSDQATYIYHAAIRSSGDDYQVVGGIGIVFNASVEFPAMLRGATLNKPNTATLFTDRQGQVIASTDPACPAGTQLTLDADMAELPKGHSLSRAVVHDGHYCIASCSASQGYREFKVSDGYRSDILALSFTRFGTVQTGTDHALYRRRSTLIADDIGSNQHEMATFFVDAGLFALEAEAVVGALPASDIASVAAKRLPYCIGTLARKAAGNITDYVWVFDLGHLLRGQASEITWQSQVVVFQHGNHRLGLLVNELHGVTAFAANKITPAPALPGQHGRLVDRLIQANQGRVLIQCLNLPQLMQVLRNTP